MFVVEGKNPQQEQQVCQAVEEEDEEVGSLGAIMAGKKRLLQGTMVREVPLLLLFSRSTKTA